MKEQYYKIEVTTNNISKNYVVSAIHELQAKNRLAKKLKYTNIAKMNVNVIE